MLLRVEALCYGHTMSIAPTKPEKAPPNSPLVLGREWFTKISAVEGISLSERQDAIIAALDERGLKGHERQRTLRDLLTRS
jgi:hypothetical protein